MRSGAFQWYGEVYGKVHYWSCNWSDHGLFLRTLDWSLLIEGRGEKGRFTWSWVKPRLSVFASSLEELAGELAKLCELAYVWPFTHLHTHVYTHILELFLSPPRQPASLTSMPQSFPAHAGRILNTPQLKPPAPSSSLTFPSTPCTLPHAAGKDERPFSLISLAMRVVSQPCCVSVFHLPQT